jgi:NNP family nitrate/nitrite transporter-like MFS transporter
MTTLPTAIGAGVRMPYTFAVARFGGRNWTIVSDLLPLGPCVAAAIAPGRPSGTSC